MAEIAKKKLRRSRQMRQSERAESSMSAYSCMFGEQATERSMSHETLDDPDEISQNYLDTENQVDFAIQQNVFSQTGLEPVCEDGDSSSEEEGEHRSSSSEPIR